MCTSSVRSKMRVVHCRDLRYSLAFRHFEYNSVLTKGYWGGRAHILVAHIVNESVEIIHGDRGLIHDHLVMHRASSALNGRVRAEVEVVLKPRTVNIWSNKFGEANLTGE